MAPFIQLKSDVIQLAADCKRLKADDYQTYLTAQALLYEAHQQAEHIKAAAQQAYEDEKARGYQDGLDEGRMQLAEQMMDTVTRTIDYFGHVEKRMAELVLQAVRKILGEFNDDELVLRIVRHVLTVVRNQKQITLRVAPEQVDVVKNQLHHLMANLPTISYVDVVADRRLNKAGCILESDMGVIDGSLDKQLIAIERAITKRLGKSPS